MKGIIAVVLSVVLFLAPCASGAVEAKALEMKTGTIAVTVKGHDGKALAGAALKLVGADGKTIRSVAANKTGECGLKDLKPGTYKLIVADRAIVHFTVSDKAKVSTLLLVSGGSGGGGHP